MHASIAGTEAEAAPVPASRRSGPFRSAGDVDGPCISVTGAGGERVYCSMQASTSGREHAMHAMSHRGQLTQDPINLLMEQVRISGTTGILDLSCIDRLTRQVTCQIFRAWAERHDRWSGRTQTAALSALAQCADCKNPLQEGLSGHILPTALGSHAGASNLSAAAPVQVEKAAFERALLGAKPPQHPATQPGTAADLEQHQDVRMPASCSPKSSTF